jgi:hypothetical protein
MENDLSRRVYLGRLNRTDTVQDAADGSATASVRAGSTTIQPDLPEPANAKEDPDSKLTYAIFRIEL